MLVMVTERALRRRVVEPSPNLVLVAAAVPEVQQVALGTHHAMAVVA